MAKILLVDDNADSLFIESALLRKLGHEVLATSSGESAILASPAFQPDVVFVDFFLPDMDGHDLGQQLRALDLAPRPRIVAVTGYSLATQLEGDGVFDRVLLKPVGLDDLKFAISG